MEALERIDDGPEGSWVDTEVSATDPRARIDNNDR